jgi:microsomal epoxide hydrolase
MAGPTTAGGLRGFLRGYFHVKSGSWKGNNPYPLIKKGESSRQLEWPMDEVVKMPEYYIMPLEATMPQAVEKMMKEESQDASKDWLSDEDLEVYLNE